MITMSFPTPTNEHNVHFRRPLDSQKNIGSDMSMMFFARSRFSKMFTSSESEQHHVQGLNVEGVTGILFPPPAWKSMSEYQGLLMESEDDNSHFAYFSLNISMYNQSIHPTELNNTWFFMYGRVHPYALTWEVHPDNYYTIPALIIRDHGYQP
jgi:hypothetical protein